jgi:hypothetical protein
MLISWMANDSSPVTADPQSVTRSVAAPSPTEVKPIPKAAIQNPRTIQAIQTDGYYSIEDSAKNKVPGFGNLELSTYHMDHKDHSLTASFTMNGTNFKCAALSLENGHLHCGTAEEDAISYNLDGDFLEVPSSDNQVNTNVLRVHFLEKENGSVIGQSTVLMRWWPGD